MITQSLAPISTQARGRIDDTVNQLLHDWNSGDEEAAERLFEAVYEELRALARRQMQGQNAGHTLQTTALVNEAYLKLFKDGARPLKDRKHFVALASHAMRSILVDHARRKNRKKRKSDGVRVPLEELSASYEAQGHDLVALDAALVKLGKVDPRMVRLVELRFFGGQTMTSAAEALGLSLRTAEREWQTARAWLQKEMT